MDNFFRLNSALLGAGIPFVRLDKENRRIEYREEATPAQRAQGEAMLAATDFTPAGEAAGKMAREKTAASAALDSPSNGDRLLRAMVLALLDEINQVRSKLSPPLPARTTAQVMAAVKAKL